MLGIRSYSSIASIGATVVIVTSLVATGVTAADAAEPPPPIPTLEHMDQYSVADYASEASALPSALISAVHRDLGKSAAEYLAESAAAADAVSVVDSLGSAQVDVLGSRVEGTTLVVNVGSKADAVIVSSVGAIPEWRAPITEDLSGLTFAPVDDLYGGAGLVWQASSNGYQCSVGFTGYEVNTGQGRLVTAGHCVASMATIEGPVRALSQSAPGIGGTWGSDIGSPVANSATFGGGFDSGLVTESAVGVAAHPKVVTWGGGAGAPLSSAPLEITGVSPAIQGAPLCKSGSRTGWTCGTVTAVDTTVNVGGSLVNSIIATACLQPGDSGGAALMGQLAVGVSSSSSNLSCSDANYRAAFFQMASTAGKASVQSRYGSSWEPAISVSTPVITSVTAETPTTPGAITGTIANASPTTVVRVYVDNSTTPYASAVAANGSWTVSLLSLPSGSHSFTAVGIWGVWSASTPAPGSIEATRSSTTIENRYLALVMSLYSDVLNRTPAPPELSGWGRIAAGGTSITSGFLLSDEYRLGRIEAAYRTILNRAPEQGSEVGWLALMRAGVFRTEDLDKYFLGSQEYFAINGSSTAIFVNSLFLRLLMRSPSASESAYWSQMTASQGPIAAVDFIWGSMEATRARIALLYLQYLGRASSPDETLGWAQYAISNGDAALRTAITNSQEYANRASARYPNANG